MAYTEVVARSPAATVLPDAQYPRNRPQCRSNVGQSQMGGHPENEAGGVLMLSQAIDFTEGVKGQYR
jgi:hypothetical protein